VPTGQVGQRRAGHPCGDGQRAGVRGRGVARPQDRAVRAERGELLGLGDDVLVVVGEEGQQAAALVALDCAPGGGPPVMQLRLGQRAGLQLAAAVVRAGRGEAVGGSSGEPSAVTRPGRGPGRRSQCRCQRGGDLGEVVVGGRGGMVVDQQSGERRPEGLSRAQLHPLSLQGGQGVLVLASARREVPGQPGRRHGGSGRPAVDVQRVGGPGDHRGGGSQDAPRVQSGLSEVLADSKRRAEPFPVQRGHVQVLADVELVDPQGTRRGERDVVRVHEVDIAGPGARVGDLDVPGPCGPVAAEGEGRPPAERAVGVDRLPGHHQDTVLEACARSRSRAEHRPGAALGPVADPQLEETGLERRCRVLDQLEPVRPEAGRRAAVDDDGAQTTPSVQHPRRPVGRTHHLMPVMATPWTK